MSSTWRLCLQTYLAPQLYNSSQFCHQIPFPTLLWWLSWQRTYLTMQETWVPSLGWEDPWRREWQPTLRILPGKFHRGGLQATVHEVTKNLTWLRMQAYMCPPMHTHTHHFIYCNSCKNHSIDALHQQDQVQKSQPCSPNYLNLFICIWSLSHTLHQACQFLW